MSATKQDLLSLKEENMKMKDNFKNFLKKYKTNKKYVPKQKVMEFMEEQDSLMDNLNLQIDNILVKNEKLYQKPTKLLPKKRKIPEILPFVGNKINPKRPRMEFVIVKNSLENIINNPGLQHLAENIFSYLNYKDLESCQRINTSSKLILANPRLWLNKFIQKGMSKKNQNDWIKAIQLTKNTKYEKNIYLYLKSSFAMKKLMDIPCYIDKEVIEKSTIYQLSQIEQQICRPANQEHIEKYVPGWIQMLAANDYNIHNNIQRKRMMFAAVLGGYLEVVKTLAPLMENPNAPLGRQNDIFQMTWSPLAFASKHGRLEIIKFLVPLSTNLTFEVIQNLKDLAHQHNHVLNFLSSL